MKKASRLLAAGVVVALVLAAVAVWTVVRWSNKVDDAHQDQARTRDAVLLQAQDAAVALSSLDYRNSQAVVARWGEVSTGDLHKSLLEGDANYQQLIATGKVVATAEVAGAAVESLSSDARSAVVLVGLDVTVTPKGKSPQIENERLVVTMTMTPQGWKASAMSPVVD